MKNPTPRRRVYRRALIGGGLLLVAASAIPMPFMVMTAGPTFDVLGTDDGTPIISIKGTETFPTTGQLSLTTVSERGGSSGGVLAGEALIGWLRPDGEVVPRELYYPEGESGEEVEAAQQADWSSSQSNAVGAAMSYLKRPVNQRPAVTLVVDGGPSDGILNPGDLIVRIDGKPISAADQVATIVRSKPVGSRLDVEVKSLQDDGSRKAKTVQVTTKEDPHTKGQPWLGIGLDTYYEAPFEIDFTLQDVGGPSAGLFFTLGLIDKLTPGDLTGGRSVAGTGTISPEGKVGPIGGIEHKLRGARQDGAELFLAPAENCDAVVGNIPDGLTVVRVEDVDDAVNAIESYAAGKRDLPACS